VPVLTPKLGLKKPVPNTETDWGFRYNESLDILDDAVLVSNTTGAGTVTVSDDGLGNVTISGSSSTPDHGALTGLSDDDHTQYIRVDGTRAFTGNQSLGGKNLTNANLISAVPDAQVTITGSAVKLVSSGTSGITLQAQGTGDITATGDSITVGAVDVLNLSGFNVNVTDSISAISMDGLGNLNVTGGSSGIVTVTVGSTSAFGATKNVGGTHELLVRGTDGITANSALKTINGTAAEPSHSFTNDTDTGMRRSAANVLSLVAGASDVVLVSGTGAGINGNLVASRGDFAAGLTVSGVPVSLGGSGGVTDHGALTGLSDDDHPQYGHLSQNESVSGIWNFPNGVTVSGVPVSSGISLPPKRLYASKTSDQTVTGGSNTNITGLTGLTIPAANGKRKYRVNSTVSLSYNAGGSRRNFTLSLYVGTNGSTSDGTPSFVTHTTSDSATGINTQVGINGWQITPAANAKVGLAALADTSDITVFGTPTTNGGSFLEVVEIQE
jgi:hypothetical protein